MTIMCLYNRELLTSLLSVLVHLLILLIFHILFWFFLLFNIYNRDTVDSLSYIYTYLSINMHSNNFSVHCYTVVYVVSAGIEAVDTDICKPSKILCAMIIHVWTKCVFPDM